MHRATSHTSHDHDHENHHHQSKNKGDGGHLRGLSAVTPDVVFFTFADSDIKVLNSAYISLSPEERFSLELHKIDTWLNPEALGGLMEWLRGGCRLVVVRLLGGERYWPEGVDALTKLAKESSGPVVVFIPGDDKPDPLLVSLSTLAIDKVGQLSKCLLYGGVSNAAIFLRQCGYVCGHHSSVVTEQARPTPAVGMYVANNISSDAADRLMAIGHIERQSTVQGLGLNQEQTAQMNHTTKAIKAAQKSLKAIQGFELSIDICAQERAGYVWILFYRAHLLAGDIAPIDALIDIFAQWGITAVGVFVSSLKDPLATQLLQKLHQQAPVAAIVTTLGFCVSDGNDDAAAVIGGTFGEEEDSHQRVMRPLIIQAVMSAATYPQWHDSHQGLLGRDIIMHVALPEIDGRIMAGAISFKEATPSPLAPGGIIHSVGHIPLVGHVVELVARHRILRITEKKHRRIAIILANYPNKDGRIGNGVGLDTPNSVVTTVQAMKDSGYDIAHTWPDGDALIKDLQRGKTNAPSIKSEGSKSESEGVDSSDSRVRASMSMDQYQRGLASLPEIVREEISTRWGNPKDDPFFDQESDQFILPALVNGHIVLAIQPARGYNIDPEESYHSPDLPPPHGYVAFYLWLKQCWGAHALVHFGKHGNIEWLPGKALALSVSCAPLALMGCIPHIYPFIVNDPGEGAQAKRRTHAVVIDHMMPPLERSDLYGDLSKMEQQLDEYHQALLLDPPRAHILSHNIHSLAIASGLAKEISVGEKDDMLDALDNHLCEIKESQIRGGLHRFSCDIPKHRWAPTVLSLCRLGWYSKRNGGHPSLLQSMVKDLQIAPPASGEVLGSMAPQCDTIPKDTNDDTSDNQHYWDPTAPCGTQPYHGPYPDLLNNLPNQPRWRHYGHTLARLEALALLIIESEVDASTIGVETQSTWHAVQDIIIPRLKESPKGEWQNFSRALGGDRVDPGPSGAPSRGIIDMLPTGRNFFSLDVRTMPTATAWLLGQRSATALIARYRKDHDDTHPTTLALSAWGTSAMRTGGDDIAQALALIGVKPQWEAASGRQTGFAVIPEQELQRPRIDVTLRVSGFFRDAFGHLVSLFDRACRAVADLDESHDINPMRAHVERDTVLFEKQGMTKSHALWHARSRVFGSKPGAYGAGLQALIDEGGWSNEGDLARAYVEWSQYIYAATAPTDQVFPNERNESYESSSSANKDAPRLLTNTKKTNNATGVDAKRDHGAGIPPELGAYGVPAKEAFSRRLSSLDVVLHNQDNREHDILDSDDYYQFHGGLTVSARVAGAAPSVYHGDHARPEFPIVRSLTEEINRVMRARVLNPKWINAMMEHGYKGAFEIAATVDYLFAFQATTKCVENHHFDNVVMAFLHDQTVRSFLIDHNHHAFNDIVDRLNEALERGLWRTSRNDIHALLEKSTVS